jgi:hypothetical protein
MQFWSPSNLRHDALAPETRMKEARYRLAYWLCGGLEAAPAE